MNATNKSENIAKLVKIWENKNAQRAVRGAALSTMALSLAACGGSSDSTPEADPTPAEPTDLTVSPETVSFSGTLNAGRAYTPGGNDLVNTLQTDDSITGTGSADVMNVTFGNANDAGAATVAPTIAGVETINFNNVGADGGVDTLDMSNVTGVQTISVSSLSDSTVIRGLDDTGIALVARTVSDEAADVVFEFDTDADGMASTTSTAVGLSINGFLGDAIAIGAGATTTAAGVEVAGTGVEIINLTSSGSASVVDSIAATGVTTIAATASADTTITGVTTTALTTVTMASDAGVTTSIDVADNANANAAFHYTGGAGDDTLRINDGFQGGAVEAADDLRGGDGDDTLRIDIDTAGTTVGALDENLAAVVTGFENIMLAIELGAGTTTTDMDFFSGANTIDLRTTVIANTFQLNDVTDAQATDIDLVVTTAAGAGATTVAVDLKDGFGTVAAGTAETLDLDVTLGLDAQTLTINDDNNNVEHLNLAINGFSTTVTADASSFQTSYTITGGAAGETLAFGAALSNTTIDFSGVASDITMTTNGTTQTVTTGAGDDDVTNNAGSKTVSLGAGDDRFTTANTLGTAGLNIDSIDGGDGTDVLEFTADMTDTAAALSAVRGFEVLDLNSGASDSINMANFVNNTGFTRVDFGDAGGAGTLAITNAGAGITTVRLNAGIAADTATFARLVDGAADVLTISARADLDGAGADMVAFTANDEETINISGSSAANDVDLGALNATDMTTLNISGAADVDTGAISSLALATIDASTASGALVLDASASNVAMTVTLNTTTGGATTITLGSGADTYTAGAGVDSITAGDGADTITLVADASVDTVVLTDENSKDTITGFDTTEDQLNVDGLTVAANIATVLATSGAVVAGALTDNSVIVITDGATALTAAGVEAIADYTNLNDVADFLAEGYNATAALDEAVFVINDLAGDQTYVYHFLENAGAASTISGAELSLVAVITEESGSALVAADVI